MDARNRLLAPVANLIPRRETLWAAVVEAPKLYSQYVSPWEDNGFGFDMRLAQHLSLNIWNRCRMSANQLLVEPKCWASLDYAVLESPNVDGDITWEVTRPAQPMAWPSGLIATLLRASVFPAPPVCLNSSSIKSFFLGWSR